MENNIEKKKNWVMVLVIILIIIILGLVGFIVYKELSSGTNNNNNSNNNNNQEDNKQNDNNTVDTSNYKYTIDVYKTDSNMLCNEKYDICKTIAFTIKTESNEANVLATNEKNIVLYNDNGLKLYNDKTKKIIKINLTKEYENYEVVNEKYLSGVKDNYLYLLNINTGKEELKEPYGDKTINEIGYDVIESYDDNVIIFKQTIQEVGQPNSKFRIYYNNKKVIDIDENNFKGGSIYNDNIYLYNNKIVNKYDLSGNLIEKYSFDSDIKGIVLDKAILYSDNKITIQDINSKKITNSIEISDKFSFAGSLYNGESKNYQISFNPVWCYYNPSKVNNKGIVITMAGKDKNGNMGHVYIIDEKTNEIITYHQETC